MKKSTIKKMSEEELAMMVNIASIDPFDAVSIMIRKGDIKKTIPSRPKYNNDWDGWSIPMKNMKRMERRKATFRKDKSRQTHARDLGYNLSSDMTSGKVKDLLSVNHSDRMYFRGSKAQEKLGKPITTKEARSLLAQMEWEDAMDREDERLEQERLFAKAELEDKKFQFDKLDCIEDSLKKTVSELIRTIYEANSKLEELEPQLNGLRVAKLYLEDEIAKLEEAVNS